MDHKMIRKLCAKNQDPNSKKRVIGPFRGRQTLRLIEIMHAIKRNLLGFNQSKSIIITCKKSKT